VVLKKAFLIKPNHNRIRLESSGKNKVIGWGMTLDEIVSFFKGQRKKVVTFLGYSVDYENEKTMLKIVEVVLAKYSPETSLINIGATYGGVGAAYPIAKSMGFITTGIVSNLAIQYLDDISTSVDHICFVMDTQWGGKLPNSNNLSPASQAMVVCSDIFIGVGGGEISRDEMIAGREQGKPVHFYPAEINHEYMIHRAQKMNLPPPDSFFGAAHEVFGNKHDL
jgi:hypothetical protein